jgi:hypothetical protein
MSDIARAGANAKWEISCKAYVNGMSALFPHPIRVRPEMAFQAGRPADGSFGTSANANSYTQKSFVSIPGKSNKKSGPLFHTP